MKARGSRRDAEHGREAAQINTDHAMIGARPRAAEEAKSAQPSPVHDWPPFTLMIADAHLGELPVPHGTPVLVRPDDIDAPHALFLWDWHAIWWTLVTGAFAALEHEKQTPIDTPDPATLDLTVLRDAAEAAPRHVREKILLAVEAVQRMTPIRDHFAAWPSTPARMRQFRCGLWWWGLDQYRRGLAAVVSSWPHPEPVLANVPTSVPAYVRQLDALRALNLDPQGTGTEVFGNALLGANAIDRRIRDVVKRIKAGQADNVMAWVLHDITVFGDNCKPMIIPLDSTIIPGSRLAQ